jgi:cell division protein FtsQ
MELPASNKTKYSFPVILGASAGEPLSTRAPRMKIYNELIGELDSSGASYSHDLSEVDLSDPDDVKVLASDSQGAVLVHLGSSNYLDRYKIYVSHLQEWRQQFAKLESVDLRYDRQIVVNPDLRGMEKPAPLTVSAVKTASAAGVKSAALISHSKIFGPPAPTKPPAKTVGPPKTSTAKTSSWKPSAKPVATKKWTPKKKTVVKAQAKPKPQMVSAASQTKLSAPPAKLAVTSTSSKKPSPSIRNQEQ